MRDRQEARTTLGFTGAQWQAIGQTLRLLIALVLFTVLTVMLLHGVNLI